MGHAGSHPKNASAGRGRLGLLGLCAAVGSLACTGGIEDAKPSFTTPGAVGQQPGSPSAGGGGTAGTAGQGGGGNQDGAGPGSCDGSLPPARAVLLTTRTYVNALRDLLGPDAISEEAAASAPEIEVEVVDRPWMTTAMLDQVVRLAEQATESLRGRTAAFLGCTALTERACVRASLERIGLRAYKRPLEPAELDDVMSVYDVGLAAVADDAGETATLLALQAILAAPSTLYRTEFLATSDATAEHALSSHERAALLGSLLLDSVPDAALLAAAADGTLMTAEGLQAQIDRLLALPRVREHLTDVVLSAYNAPRIFETPKDGALFPEYTPALQRSMYEETRRFVHDVLFTRQAALDELLTSRRTFVDAALAELYGLPAPATADAFAAVELPAERAGLLTQASVLSVLSRTDKTSVVARGLFVRGALLCLPKIPSPPDSVQAQVAAQLDADASQQELSDYRAMTTPCSGCHSQFDRFGLLLEGFDPVGRLREEPIAEVDLTGLSPFDGVVGGAAELAQRMAEDGQFVSCMAQRTLAYALTEPYQSGAACDAERLHEGVRQRGGTMHALISAVASQPAFTRRSSEEP